MEINLGDYLVSFVVAVGFGFIVAMDAKKRGMNSFFWGLGTCLVLIVFLPLYIISRRYYPEISQEKNEP